ncbi:MAG TPA: hypothetical protein VGB20_04430 [bacterium]
MPWLFWFSTPKAMSVFLAHRAATWTGGVYLWRRFRRHPWCWGMAALLNLQSAAALALLWRGLHR